MRPLGKLCPIFSAAAIIMLILPQTQLTPIPAVYAASSSRALLYWKTWGGSSLGDTVQDVAVDHQDNIYLAGYSGYGVANGDTLLLKFNSTGLLQWARTWGGLKLDYATSLVVDGQNNIYLAGTTYSFGAGGADIFLLKFDSSGSLLWQRTWGGNSSDYADAVAIDGVGNVYVKGETNSTGSGGTCTNGTYPYRCYDIALLKFSSNGTLLWQETLGGLVGGYQPWSYSVPRGGLAVDTTGNLYITSATNSFGAGGKCGGVYPNYACYNALLVKLNSTGGVMVENTLGVANSTESGVDVITDQTGGVYVAGDGFDGVFLARYDSTGQLVWGSRFGEGGWHMDDIASAPGGRIIVVTRPSLACYAIGSYCGPIPLLLSFTTSGGLEYYTLFGDTAFNLLVGNGVAVDSSGGYLMAGVSVSLNPPTPPTDSSLILSLSNITTTPQPFAAHPIVSNYTAESPNGIIESPQGTQGPQTIERNGFAFLLTYGPSVQLSFRTSPANQGNITCTENTYHQTQTLWDGTTGSFPANSTLTCQANPGPGYRFMGWSGLTPSQQNPVTIKATDGALLEAQFALTTNIGVLPQPPIALGPIILAVAFTYYLKKRRFLSI